MKKKRTGTWIPLKKSRAKILMIMKLTFLLICGFVLSLSASVKAQDQMVTLKVEDMPFLKVISELKRQTQLDFFYSFDEVDIQKTVTLNVKNVKIGQVLRDIFGKGFTWEYVDNVVVIKPVQIVTRDSVNKLIEVSGRVVDERGNSIPGATVLIQGSTQGVATDIEGRYKIRAKATDALRVSFIGYKTEVVAIKGKTKLNITLNPTAENIDEVTVVAFGEQKKESVVSAITTVRPMDLKSSSSDLTSSFVGKIAGIIGWQTGGAPGALTEEEMNTKFYVRGISSSSGVSEPLVLIDGVESSRLDLARMAPEDIESFSVLKDASATAMYGARGANGVILVTTKKGEEGSVYTSVRYEMVASMPTDNIEVVDPQTYMRMYNEALLTRNPLASPAYSLTKIERTGDPRFPSWVYPANDWYDILFKDYSINHRVGLNVRGGGSVMQYYASVNYVNDQGMLKTDRLNQFDVNIKNSTLSSRVNLNINLNAGIRLLLNTSFSIDKYHGPMAEVQQAYAMAFNASPVNFAPIYPGTRNTVGLIYGLGIFLAGMLSTLMPRYSKGTKVVDAIRLLLVQNTFIIYLHC